MSARDPKHRVRAWRVKGTGTPPPTDGDKPPTMRALTITVVVIMVVYWLLPWLSNGGGP